MTENQMIAREILRQLGAYNLMGWGVRQKIAIDQGVNFDISAFGRKKHWVEIRLNELDLYDVVVRKETRKKDKDLGVMVPQIVDVYEINNVYNDMLAEIIENQFKACCY